MESNQRQSSKVMKSMRDAGELLVIPDLIEGVLQADPTP